MSDRSARLPKQFPAGSTYIVESRGVVQDMMLVDRYVRLPDGRRIDLAARLVPSCGKAEGRKSVIRQAAPARRRAMARGSVASDA